MLLSARGLPAEVNDTSPTAAHPGPRPLPPAEEFQAIARGNFCSGCGACAVATDGRLPVLMQRDGSYGPDLTAAGADDLATAARVCPFSSHGPDEDVIAQRLFPDLPHHWAIGRHRATLVGHVAEPDYRARGSSGGLTSWIAARLLAAGEIDGVVHVKPGGTAGSGPLFSYGVSTSVEELGRGAKSRYYPVELSAILLALKQGPGKRYAFVGVPCFLKALRRLADADPEISDMVAVTIGLFCGHQKSAHFAAYLAWQAGIAPEDLATIDFRHKLEDRAASDYAMQATAADGRVVTRRMAELDGRDWGQGWFRLKACDYCDDVVAETADLSVGDAWLPGWVDDWRGTNVAVVRSERMLQHLEAGMADTSLAMQPLSADDVARSQDAGLRHRREGLAWRLHRATMAGEWAPTKRVAPHAGLAPGQQRVLEIRSRMSELSPRAWEAARIANDPAAVADTMRPLQDMLATAVRPPWRERLTRELRRVTGHLLQTSGR